MMAWKSIPGFFSPFLVILTVFILVLYSIYIVYIAATNISYDGSHLFIADRKTERIILLSNIKEVRRSFSIASPRTRWKIAYIDHNGLDCELYFYPENNAAMVPFIRVVRMKNPIARCD